MQNKHQKFFLWVSQPPVRGGGVKPVGTKSQLLPKICFACFPKADKILVFETLNNRLIRARTTPLSVQAKKLARIRWADLIYFYLNRKEVI